MTEGQELLAEDNQAKDRVGELVSPAQPLSTPSGSEEKVSFSQMELRYLRNRVNYQPWLEWTEAVEEEQKAFQDILRRRAGAVSIGANCFISPDACVYTDRLAIGQNSWIAAGAIVRGNITIGSNSSVNPLAHIAGNVTIGSGVRIAGMVSIYGFNHGFASTERPIYQQAHTSKGIVIGDGTWIGANAVVVDGVKIGDHCIVGAGAVVTKDLPDYSIAGGNPAVILANRLCASKNVPSNQLRLDMPWIDRPDARPHIGNGQ